MTAAAAPSQRLALPAVLTHDEAPALLESLAAGDAASGGWRVDASALRQFDSSALAVLLAYRRAALSAGGDFSIADPPPKLVRLVEVYGVGKLLLAAEDRPAAA